MPFDVDKLREKWQGQTVYIVGAGTSLVNFDWSRLVGKHVLGINRAFDFVPCDCTITLDDRFVKWAHKQRAAWFTSEQLVYVGLVHKSDNGIYSYVKQIPSLEVLGRIEEVWSTDFSTLRAGTTSGVAALNLADAAGAAEIVLLGFDAHPGYDYDDDNDKQEWFHEGYPWARQPCSVYRRFAQKLAEVAPRVRAQVWNCSPGSAVSCFAFPPVETFLRLLGGSGD